MASFKYDVASSARSVLCDIASNNCSPAVSRPVWILSMVRDFTAEMHPVQSSNRWTNTIDAVSLIETMNCTDIIRLFRSTSINLIFITRPQHMWTRRRPKQRLNSLGYTQSNSWFTSLPQRKNEKTQQMLIARHAMLKNVRTVLITQTTE